MSPKLLEYQLELIKIEVAIVNDSIRQMDEITKSVKEWTVGIWAAALGGALITPAYSSFAAVTSVIPLLFWLVDTWYRRIQRKFIWRSIQISKFLNGPALERSFEAGRVIDFTIFDPKNRVTAGDGYDVFISWRRVMLFRSVSIFYIGMIAISTAAGLIVYLRATSHW